MLIKTLLLKLPARRKYIQNEKILNYDPPSYALQPVARGKGYCNKYQAPVSPYSCDDEKVHQYNSKYSTQYAPIQTIEHFLHCSAFTPVK